MSDGRLTIRFSAAYQAWIAAAGGEKADAVRALMVLGAASLGLPGAAREARRLLDSGLTDAVGQTLLDLADNRQTTGRQPADTALNRPFPVAGTAVPLSRNARNEPENDPLADIGIEV